jgi:diguanylate cyclase
VLLDLLDHLEVPEILQDRVMVLRERINAGHIADEWGSLLDDLTDLIDALRNQMRDDQEELEEFLSEVSQRLQEMDAHLSGSAESQQQGRESRDTMDAAVRREVEEIGSSVRDAVDLNELKSSVASHLESVLGNMNKFQQSEEARYLENQQAMQAMSEKLKTMEQETETLRDQVVQERNQAMTDVLTGIPNRLAYDQRLQQEVARWKRFATPLVLMVWDVDLFKSVNDTYGHKAGDKVLKKLAMGLKRGIRETDFVARYGGEEFVMLMTGSTVEACLQVADKLRASLGEIGFHFRGKSVVVTASCGLSEYREDDTPEQLFERADKALYEAKEQGRNRCIIG